MGPRPVARWSWEEVHALPRTAWRRDIHCVTTWSKFDTDCEGVTFDDLLEVAGVEAPSWHVLAHSADGYSTNLELGDLQGRAMVALSYDGPEAVGAALARLPEPPRHVYVCGSTGFVETAAALLLAGGLAPGAVRTERYGGA